MNNTNVNDAFFSLAKAVKARLIDSQEAEQEKSRPVQLAANPVDRLRSACCFGGGSGSGNGSVTQSKSSKGPKSSAYPTKGAKTTQ